MIEQWRSSTIRSGRTLRWGISLRRRGPIPQLESGSTTPGYDINSLTAAGTKYQRRHVFLASDELAGRQANTQFNRIASQYLANRFELMGLEPWPRMAISSTSTCCRDG